MVGYIGLGLLIILLFLRMPVGFVMFFVGFAGFGYVVSLSASTQMVAIETVHAFTLYAYSAIPPFVLMGYLAFQTGVSRRLFDAAQAWIGQLRGGLAMSAIVASAAFGAICGSGVATVATMGIAAYPPMKEHGYDASMSTACIAAGSVLGPMIPPSIVFIIYGILTENSIGALFLAGILPGILLVLLFIITISLQVLRNPSLAPSGASVSWGKKLSQLATGTFETIIIFLLVMTALTMGIATPTEAGAFGVVSVLLVTMVRRQIIWRGIYEALTNTLRTVAFVYVCLAGVGVLGHFLAVTQIPTQISSFVAGLDVPTIAIMVGVLLVYFLAGCIIDPLPFIVLTIPTFYPVVISLGYDPIWYGVIMVMVCGVGSITPPVGMMVYIISGVSGVSPTNVFRGVWPYVLTLLVGTAILLACPQIATFLPNIIMPSAG